MANIETTDVLIVGCGPTGAMLSGYLGQLGVSNVVLERDADVNTDPRGIVLDDDGIRLVQGLGLYSDIFTKIGSAIPRLRFVGGVHSNLQTKPFLSFNTATHGHTGHIGLIGHKQPELERSLRSATNNNCQLRTSCTLQSLEEDEDYVYATYRGEDGEKTIRSRFLAAADGKTGYTRKHYLEAKGVNLEWAEKTQYEETWVALNWRVQLPTPETHPSFPLWKLGYSPQEVYDLFFPTEFRFLCNPHRPAVCGRFGLPEDRLWRFEFVVAPGENGEEMAKKQNIEKVVVPYITHPGNRYGLTGDVRFPEDCIEVLRSRPFRFSARSCNKWAVDRVILCGDAAHVFPPFGGQGIVSGFRDVVALAWRLQILISNPRLDYEPILAGWYNERKQQLDHSLAATVRNGDLVSSRSVVQNYARSWIFGAMQWIPSWKTQLEMGPRAGPPARYIHSSLMPFLPTMGGGVCFPQIYCMTSRGVQFTDDIIFTDKKKVFQLGVLLDGFDRLESALEDLEGIGNSFISADEATFFARRGSTQADADTRVVRSASDKEFEQSPLCNGRPAPSGYNEFSMWESAKARYVILRFDRFVFAVCNTRAELQDAVGQIERYFT